MAEALKLAYNEAFINQLANDLKQSDKNFNVLNFEARVFDNKWDDLELKDRMHHITKCIYKALPYPLEKQIEILHQVAPNYSSYTALIFPNFIELYAINNIDLALETLKVFTIYSTAEFAIRPFIEQDESKTMAFLEKCALDENFHVRRLASEGCRPLLPWSFKIVGFVNDPSPIMPILELLKNDPEDYVYRSVANNLNDVSKHHPDLVIETCAKWLKKPSKHTKWVVKHALRTLLKKGNIKALQLIGIDSNNQLKLTDFKIEHEVVKIGNSTRLNIKLINKNAANLFRIEYVVYYLKNNGKHAPKVFQVKEVEIKNLEKIELSKKLVFKNFTTRKHYVGEHFIALKVNGTELNKIPFTLT